MCSHPYCLLKTRSALIVNIAFHFKLDIQTLMISLQQRKETCLTVAFKCEATLIPNIQCWFGYSKKSCFACYLLLNALL